MPTIINKCPVAWGNNWFARKTILTNYKGYFLIHFKISQHIRIQPSNYKGPTRSIAEPHDRVRNIFLKDQFLDDLINTGFCDDFG